MVNDFGYLPLPDGRLSTTMLMQLSGQICSQRRQPTHISSPFSGSRRSLGTPRNRGCRSGVSFGYSSVMCGLNWFLSVMSIPWIISIGNTLRINAFAVMRLLASSLVPQYQHESGDHDVDQRQRKQPLPAEAHQLIVPVAREGPAQPDV